MTSCAMVYPTFPAKCIDFPNVRCTSERAWRAGILTLVTSHAPATEDDVIGLGSPDLRAWAYFSGNYTLPVCTSR
jgi:hypothetical protein